MAILKIPVSSEGFFSEKISLGGKLLNLEFRFNERENLWHMNILDSSNNMLLAGRAVVSSLSLTHRFINRIEGLPSGTICAVDTTGEYRNADEDTFGGDVPMIYVEV